MVTEGFAGNIALKTAEGTAKQIGELSARCLDRTLMAKLGYSAGAQAPSRRCARRWIRARSMAACSSASMASWSRATAAPMRWASPRAIDVAYDMAQNDLVDKITADLPQ